MKISKIKIFIILSFLCCFTTVFYFDLFQYLNFDFILAQRDSFLNLYEDYPLLVIFSFFIIYVLTTGFSVPGAAVLTLVAGYLFGLLIGTLIISFASALGATMAFLMSRFLLKDLIQEKFKSKLKTINEGFQKDGIFYLLTLRLIPLFPFFMVNLVMGITPIRVIPYFIASQLGMLPGTIVYVNAGTQISKINSLKDILSPMIILSFLVLALLPWIIKGIMKFVSFKKKG